MPQPTPEREQMERLQERYEYEAKEAEKEAQELLTKASTLRQAARDLRDILHITKQG